MDAANAIVAAAHQLSASAGALRFGAPVTHVYNPLCYAREPHADYLQRWGRGRKRVVFMGMNPGPWGMVQTGVPFGEVAAARDWLQVRGVVGQPRTPHPKRPVQGWECPRSEVSGQRLWGLFAARFGTPERFFTDHFVANYCPLVFMEASGRNRTPDKLPAAERAPLLACCDEHLRAVCAALQPEWLIGVGRFARDRAAAAVQEMDVQVAQVLHPSPASPRANRGWGPQAAAQLEELGVW